MFRLQISGVIYPPYVYKCLEGEARLLHKEIGEQDPTN